LAGRVYGGDLGATGERLGAGGISVDQAQAIHQGTKGLPADAVAVVEAVMLESAVLAPEQLRVIGETVKSRLRDTESREAAYQRQQATRGLTVGDCGDGVLIHGLLTPDTATLDLHRQPDGTWTTTPPTRLRHAA
jgi:hypothetical protein